LAIFFRCSANYRTASRTSGSMPSSEIVMLSRTFLSESRKSVHRWSYDI